MTDDARDELIRNIAADVKMIRHDLDRDYKVLYGDGEGALGKNGLIAMFVSLETEVKLIKQSQSFRRILIHYVASIVAAILSGGIVGWLTSKF